MSVGALQHGVSPESLVGLLNGNVSDSGVDVTPFKDLGGCLGRLGEEERRIGSPLTEAIKVRAEIKVCSLDLKHSAYLASVAHAAADRREIVLANPIVGAICLRESSWPPVIVIPSHFVS